MRALISAFFLVLTIAGTALAVPAARPAPPAYAYDASRPVAATFGAARSVRGVVTRSFSFKSPTGNMVTGVVIAGKATRRQPGILFVHWLGDPKTTNHTEFIPDAVALARRGATSILVDAMWSRRGWFRGVGKDAERDYRATVNQVIDLRRALDLLLMQPNVDPKRIAFVGHDFGGMVGALLSAVDRRPQYYVFMAVTPKFSDWYLLGKQHPRRAAYVARLGGLDTLEHLWRSRAKAYLFQFSGPDKYVSAAEATAFFEAAPRRRGVYYYDADHDLAIPAAARDRQAWLVDELW
jgi:alpha/beta superfamily hydrolase